MNESRSWILWGAAATVVGIATALIVEPTLGGLMLVGGVVLTLLGLHRLGRSGADPGA